MIDQNLLNNIFEEFKNSNELPVASYYDGISDTFIIYHSRNSNNIPGYIVKRIRESNAITNLIDYAFLPYSTGYNVLILNLALLTALDNIFS